MLHEKNRKNDKKLATGLFGTAIMLVTLGAGCASEKPSVRVETDTGASVDVNVLPPTTEPPQPKPSTGTSSYKDGSYTAQGTYAFHSGTENVTITLALKNGIVIDSQYQATPSNGMSARYMQMFSDDYQPMVIGKNLDEVCALGKVSGSSLTPNGFDDACAKIRIQAKA